MNPDAKRRVQLGIGVAIFVFAVVISYFFGITEATEPPKHDIYMVLDVSGSMIEPPSKLESAKNAAQEFVSSLQLSGSSDFRVGLIVFADDVDTPVSLTNDQNRLNDVISTLTAGGATAMGDAISIATEKLSKEARPDVTKIILLLTDGENTAGIKNPITAAGSAATAGVTIFAVGYGNDADMITLSTIASVTGGKKYEAASGQDLVTTFTDIADIIISPVAQYSSRTLILFALPILLFIPAIEKGITTMIGMKETIPVCSRCNHLNTVSAKFCAKCGNPMKRGK